MTIDHPLYRRVPSWRMTRVLTNSPDGDDFSEKTDSPVGLLATPAEKQSITQREFPICDADRENEVNDHVNDRLNESSVNPLSHHGFAELGRRRSHDDKPPPCATAGSPAVLLPSFTPHQTSSLSPTHKNLLPDSLPDPLCSSRPSWYPRISSDAISMKQHCSVCHVSSTEQACLRNLYHAGQGWPGQLVPHLLLPGCREVPRQ